MSDTETRILDLRGEIAADREAMARLFEIEREAKAFLAADRKRAILDGGTLTVVAAQEREALRAQVIVGAGLRVLEAELSRRQQTRRWAVAS